MVEWRVVKNNYGIGNGGRKIEYGVKGKQTESALKFMSLFSDSHLFLCLVWYFGKKFVQKLKHRIFVT